MSVSAEEIAQALAGTYEPSLDWDSPSDYDLLDREELLANAERFMRILSLKGLVIERLDDLVLNEFD